MSGPPPVQQHLRDLFLQLLLEVARSPASLNDPALRQEIQRAVAQGVAMQMGPARDEREHRRLVSVVLRRLRQGLYSLGGAGVGLSLAAIFTRAVGPLSIVAGLLASLVVLLFGVLIEMLERPS